MSVDVYDRPRLSAFLGAAILFLSILTLPQLPVSAEETVEPVFIDQGPLGELIARVGRGGVPRHEFEYLLSRASEEAKLDPEKFALKARRRLLEHEMLIETLFQAALQQGIHGQPEYRKALVGYYLERRILQVKAALNYIPQEEMKAYYKDNPGRFMSPVEVRWKQIFMANPKYLPVEDGVDTETAFSRWDEESLERFERLLADPKISDEWKDSPGWRSMNQGCPRAFKQTPCDGLFEQEKDSVQLYETPGGRLVIWMIERKEAEQISFDEIGSGKMEREILLFREANRREMLIKGLQREWGKLADEELFFRDALKRGIHRYPAIREALIFEMVKDDVRPWEEVAGEFKKAFMNKLLIGNLMKLTARPESPFKSGRDAGEGYRQRDLFTGKVIVVEREVPEAQASWWREHRLPEDSMVSRKIEVDRDVRVSRAEQLQQDRREASRAKPEVKEVPAEKPEDQKIEEIRERLGAVTGEQAAADKKFKSQLLYVIVGILVINVVVFMLRKTK